MAYKRRLEAKVGIQTIKNFLLQKRVVGKVDVWHVKNSLRLGPLQSVTKVYKSFLVKVTSVTNSFVPSNLDFGLTSYPKE